MEYLLISLALINCLQFKNESMNILKFKYIVIIAGIVFLITSCNKSKPRKEKEEETVIKDPVKKLLVPVKLESKTLVINIKYYEGSAFISEIKSSDRYSYNIRYKDQLPYIIDKYINKVPIQYIDYRRTANKDLKIVFFDVDGDLSTPTGSLILKQNIQNQVTAIQVSGNGYSYPYTESEWHYSPSGNLSNITVGASSIKYTHDEKNGIFKNVQHTQLLFLAIDLPFFSADMNNRLSYSNTDMPNENTDFEYKYNTDGYPTQFSIIKSKQTFTITYIELPQ